MNQFDEAQMLQSLKRLGDATDLMAHAVQAMSASMEKTAEAMNRLVGLIESDMKEDKFISTLPSPNDIPKAPDHCPQCDAKGKLNVWRSDATMGVTKEYRCPQDGTAWGRETSDEFKGWSFE